MDSAYIYILEDPRTGEIRYVGKAFNLKQRLGDHIGNRYRGTCKNKSWIISLVKSGVAPVIRELEFLQNVEPETWEEAESFWIETLRFYGCKLNNMTTGGDSGKRMSPEAIQKRVAQMKGKNHTEEHKEKIRISCTVRMTPEEKSRLRTKLLGRKMHSEEFKQKMSLLKTGVARPDHVTNAREAGRERWKEETGRRTTRFCVLCNEVIKYNFLKDGTRVPDLHFFTEGIGYIHNKCKKKYHSNNQ